MTKPAERLRGWGRETMTGEDSLSWKCAALLDECERVLATDAIGACLIALDCAQDMGAEVRERCANDRLAAIRATLAKLRGEQ